MKSTSKTKSFICGKKAAVALSGGVDSAVAALLLLKEGAKVEGIFARSWHPEYFPCTEEEDLAEAARVAAHLSIPLRVVDLSKEYERDVAKVFLDAYRRGLTPNPDILCNQNIKFGPLAKEALQSSEFFATGHYARIVVKDGQSLIAESADKNKDQTYFLSGVDKGILPRVVFPIGHLLKKEVREIALKAGLPNALRPDSQGICFLGHIPMKEFLKSQVAVSAGNVLNEKGEVIGRHAGASLYTLGERHGFQIAAQTSKEEARYVISKNTLKNELTVAAASRTEEHGAREVRFSTWNSFVREKNLDVLARLRHRGEMVPARVDPRGRRAYFEKSVLVSPGQWAAFYKDGTLLFGGEVAET